MEFKNEHFIKGQKHLLQNITNNRKRHSHALAQSPQPQAQNTSAVPLIETGQFGGLMEEIEMLKRDKNTLKQELIRLRQQQQITNNQLQTMLKSIHIMEHRQQLMMSFLAKVVQNPGFFTQFVQQQNEINNKKRRLSSQESGSFSDGQIIKYQPPLMNEFMMMVDQIPNAKLETMNTVDCFSVDDTQNEPGATLSEFPGDMEGLIPLSPILDESMNDVEDMLDYDTHGEPRGTVSDNNATEKFEVLDDNDVLKLIETELEQEDSPCVEVNFDDPDVLEFMNEWIGNAQSNESVPNVQRADIVI